MKVRRRLDRLGATPLKSSVYVLPHTAGTVEDFQWLPREIVAAGGEGSACEATFIAGMTDAQLVAGIVAARATDDVRLAHGDMLFAALHASFEASLDAAHDAGAGES